MWIIFQECLQVCIHVTLKYFHPLYFNFMVTAGNTCTEDGKIKHLINKQRQSHAVVNRKVSTSVCLCDRYDQMNDAQGSLDELCLRESSCVCQRVSVYPCECVCVCVCLLAGRWRKAEQSGVKAEEAEAADRLTLPAS